MKRALDEELGKEQKSNKTQRKYAKHTLEVTVNAVWHIARDILECAVPPRGQGVAGALI